MDTALAYLLNFLEDEFRDFSEVRVRLVAKAGTQRSPDLPQDYDSEANDLHLRQGVRVQTRRKEFYFPLEWSSSHDYERIRAQVEVVRESLNP